MSNTRALEPAHLQEMQPSTFGVCNLCFFFFFLWYQVFINVHLATKHSIRHKLPHLVPSHYSLQKAFFFTYNYEINLNSGCGMSHGSP